MIPGEVGYLIFPDNGEVPRGRKRQSALEAATADYVSFFDDDDLPSADFVSSVMDAISEVDEPDIIGFKLRYFMDSVECGYAIHSFGCEKYPDVPAPKGIYQPARWARFNRFPNHLNPVRREIALRAGFHDGLDAGEDADFSRRIARMEPRPREAFVDRFLYDYFKRTKVEPHEVTYERIRQADYAARHPVPVFA